MIRNQLKGQCQQQPGWERVGPFRQSLHPLFPSVQTDSLSSSFFSSVYTPRVTRVKGQRGATLMGGKPPHGLCRRVSPHALWYHDLENSRGWHCYTWDMTARCKTHCAVAYSVSPRYATEAAFTLSVTRGLDKTCAALCRDITQHGRNRSTFSPLTVFDFARSIPRICLLALGENVRKHTERTPWATLLRRYRDPVLRASARR